MNTIAIKQRKTFPGYVISREDPKIWSENKKPMNRWAAREVAQKGYNAGTARTLDIIISQTDSDGITIATLETIHNKLIAKYGKSAPSRRSVDNHVAALVAGKTIKRSEQKRAKSLVKTRLLMPKLVDCSTQLLRTEPISSDIGDRKDKFINPSRAINEKSKAAFAAIAQSSQQMSKGEKELEELRLALLF